ncbi:HTH domain-containing protein [Pseudoalteromonas neustonica]|uniref:HTH domain-containing protein n=1 Tax=Pseudoalteromonas neustonica TaxID=1840331 RepID=UPI0007DB2A61|nr:HTH domain-containing protein [Pseudoalteromonas neustonica]
MPEDNPLVVQSKTNVANTLRALAEGIENGNVSSYEINQSSNGSITVKADSSDGTARVIQTQTQMAGYTETSTQHIEKQPAEIRRETVKKLLDQGLTQASIAEKTMVSQKTISNDVKKIISSGTA